MASISPVDSIGSRIRGFVAAGESKKINIFSSAYLIRRWYNRSNFQSPLIFVDFRKSTLVAILLLNLARFDLLHIFPN
jgi:hypothetical protein